MKTGDVVQDAKGRVYQVGQLLGRGLWGKSYMVRQEETTEEFVLKCPLSREDFRGDVPAPDDLITGCRNILLEQGRLLDEGRWPFLPRLVGRFTTGDGTPVLLLPKYTTTLEKRIQSGCPVAEVVNTLCTVLQHLRLLGEGPGVHGNLRPSNIYLNERGDVFLADIATRSSKALVGRLHAIAHEPNRYLAPEIAGSLDENAFTASVDTYAICGILFKAVMTPSHGTMEPNTISDVPVRGLDKAEILTVKDRIDERLRSEESNDRFHRRVADRVAAVLNRGVSLETAPSPPFRFKRVTDLLPRLQEIHSLIRPEVVSVGKVIINRPTANQAFETNEPIQFSVSVAASPGVEVHEELAPGIALFDQESGEQIRIEDSGYEANRHPSGRFRFAFTLQVLPPSRYMIKVAFAIKGSGHPPVTSQSTFEVRAAPGYVPPPKETAPQALPFNAPESPEEGDTSVDKNSEPVPASPTFPDIAAEQDWSIDTAQNDPLQAIDDPADPTFPGDLSIPLPISPSPMSSLNFEDSRPSSPGFIGEAGAMETLNNETGTDPAFREPTQLPKADPREDHLGIQSWTELPLPSPKQELRESHKPPTESPEPVNAGPNKLERLVEIMREDPYVAFMGAGIVLISLLLLLTLFVPG
jgi:serine/threonine protein kinase